MEAVWAEEGVKAGTLCFWIFFGRCNPSKVPSTLHLPPLQPEPREVWWGFLKVGKRETLDQINSLHVPNGLLHRSDTHHYPPFTPHRRRRRRQRRWVRFLQIACTCMCERGKVVKPDAGIRPVGKLSVCVCVWLLLNWMGGHAEVKSRLYWIIKRNWVALITPLLLSPLLASDTDRAETTVKQRLRKRKRFSATVCVQLAYSLPEPSLSSSPDHNIVPTLYRCWAELSAQAASFTPRGSQLVLQFQHAPL